ncbi:hypothetical protein FRC04_001828 [Tulasnella sp. 424]|nr:hypothetical protein FRC04_001828 [Tulasnella sp. 424]KAG8977611.1 hypothetical protein FRC05_000867 [Tulasnella sp. 425]
MSISSLPEEIFIQIVEILVQPYDEQRSARLDTLRLVCRPWNKLIQRTSSLWTYIWNGTSNTYVEQALLRSGTLGLKVRASHWSKLKNQNRERFWSAVLPHIDRWEHAELELRLWEIIPLARAGTAAPRLRSLVLGHGKRQAIDGLFPWPLPNLESLEIRDGGFRWTPQQFPSARLKYLYIAGKNGGPNLPDFVDIVRRCQELVSLHLTMPFQGSRVVKNLASISLPNLEIIALGFYPKMADKCKLLEALHVPKCRLITFQFDSWSANTPQFEVFESLAGRIGTAKVQNRAILELQGSGNGMDVDCDIRATDGGGSLFRLRLVSLSLAGQVLEAVGPFFHRLVSSFGPNAGWDIRVMNRESGFLAPMLSVFRADFPTTLTLTITRPVSRIPSWYLHDPLLPLYARTSNPKFPCLEQLEIPYCKAFANGILWMIMEKINPASGDRMASVWMRIKVPKDMDEFERVELAWLADQVPNLTVLETDSLLRES